MGFISRLRFCWRPWGVKLNFGWNSMYLRKSNICSHTLVSVESEVISWDVGLQMEGMPALDLRDVVMRVLTPIMQWEIIVEKQRSTVKCRGTERAVNKKAPTPTPKRRDTATEKLMNCVLSVTLSQAQNLFNLKLGGTFLNEHNEAVIKMTLKGSPTMRHASRTHRVALDFVVW